MRIFNDCNVLVVADDIPHAKKLLEEAGIAASGRTWRALLERSPVGVRTMELKGAPERRLASEWVSINGAGLLARYRERDGVPYPGWYREKRQ